MMRNWKHKVEIKDLIGDDPFPPASEMRDKCIEIVKRFDRHLPIEQRSDDLHSAVDEFAWLGQAKGDTDHEMVESFNDCLGALYDVCDADRVWLGL